ncbi:MAG: hypothetical protein LBE97_02860, partial [Holosporales bacterium]|nr:hypothetical protein [Holosporales bacterium]
MPFFYNGSCIIRRGIIGDDEANGFFEVNALPNNAPEVILNVGPDIISSRRNDIFISQFFIMGIQKTKTQIPK